MSLWRTIFTNRGVKRLASIWLFLFLDGSVLVMFFNGSKSRQNLSEHTKGTFFCHQLLQFDILPGASFLVRPQRFICHGEQRDCNSRITVLVWPIHQAMCIAADQMRNGWCLRPWFCHSFQSLMLHTCDKMWRKLIFLFYQDKEKSYFFYNIRAEVGFWLCKPSIQLVAGARWWQFKLQQFWYRWQGGHDQVLCEMCWDQRNTAKFSGFYFT